MGLLRSLPVPAIFLYSIVAAAALVYFPFLLVAYGRVTTGGYDPGAPRAMFDKLPAFAQRASWAHQNSFESFSLFAAALMAYVTGVDSVWAAGAAIAYMVGRFFYSVFYVLNVPIGRSLMFGVGSLSIATLMLASLAKL